MEFSSLTGMNQGWIPWYKFSNPKNPHSGSSHAIPRIGFAPGLNLMLVTAESSLQFVFLA